MPSCTPHARRATTVDRRRRTARRRRNVAGLGRPVVTVGSTWVLLRASGHRGAPSGRRTCVGTHVRERTYGNERSLSISDRSPQAEQMFDLGGERPYDAGHDGLRSSTSPTGPFADHGPPAPGARLHRAADARPRLPAVGPRDRRGHRAHVAVHGAQPPQHAAAPRLPAPRPDQAAGHRGALGPQLRRRDGAPAGPPRPARRRRRRRHRRARRGERRGAAPGPGRLHRRGRAVHAAGARRLDDRRRHPRRRLRRSPSSSRRPTTATSSSPASPAARRRSRRSPGAGGDGRRSPRPTRRWSRWSSTRATSSSTAGSSP